jgi:hypothetical protein
MLPLKMQHTFIRAILGPWCDAGISYHGFEHHAADLCYVVVGQPDILRFFLPQSYHCILKDTRTFFLSTATLHDVTLPPGTAPPNPKRTRSNLEVATAQLLNLQNMGCMDVPAPLIAPFRPPKRPAATTGRPPDATTPGGTITKHPKLTGTNRWEPPATVGATATTTPSNRCENTDQPTAFRNDANLTRLLAHSPRMKINDMCQAANIRGWSELARQAGLPKTLCASYGLKGSCHDQCNFATKGGHAPAAQWPPDACTQAIALLRPGIQALLDKANN